MAKYAGMRAEACCAPDRQRGLPMAGGTTLAMIDPAEFSPGLMLLPALVIVVAGGVACPPRFDGAMKSRAGHTAPRRRLTIEASGAYSHCQAHCNAAGGEMAKPDHTRGDGWGRPWPWRPASLSLGWVACCPYCSPRSECAVAGGFWCRNVRRLLKLAIPVDRVRKTPLLAGRRAACAGPKQSDAGRIPA